MNVNLYHYCNTTTPSEKLIDPYVKQNYVNELDRLLSRGKNVRFQSSRSVQSDTIPKVRYASVYESMVVNNYGNNDILVTNRDFNTEKLLGVIGMKAIEDLFESDNWVDVISFIENNDMNSYLFEAKDIVRDYFGDAEVKLVLKSDPEDEDWCTLHAYIKTKLSLEEGLKKMSEYRRNWVIPNRNRITERVHFKVVW